MPATPYYISNVQNLFRGDVNDCIEREEFLNMCFGEIEYAPKCPSMGNCLNFQEVDDYCLLTKRVFTVYEDINPAFTRGEAEQPLQSTPAMEQYFEGKPMKAEKEFADWFAVTDEFKQFFESECPLSQLPAMYGKTFTSIAKQMENKTKSIDLSFEMVMWATLLSATETDMFGDPIWGTHPNNVVPYTNLFTGENYDISDKTPEEIHEILINARAIFENMRNPFTGDYMYCRENCVDVYVSRCLMDKLIKILQLEEFGKADSCCSNIEICNSGYFMPRMIGENVSPFMLKRGQFRFVECDMLDQTKLSRLIAKDATLPADKRLMGGLLDVNLDNAWLMVFPERIQNNKILQKHFSEIPGGFTEDRDKLARVTKLATYGRGWFDIIEGTGMILYDGRTV